MSPRGLHRGPCVSSSSSNCSVPVARAYPLIGIRQTVPCRAFEATASQSTVPSHCRGAPQGATQGHTPGARLSSGALLWNLSHPHPYFPRFCKTADAVVFVVFTSLYSLLGGHFFRASLRLLEGTKGTLGKGPVTQSRGAIPFVMF